MGINLLTPHSPNTKGWSKFTGLVSRAMTGSEDDDAKCVRKAVEEGDDEALGRAIQSAVGNPDPRNFEMVRVEKVGEAAVVEVVYPSCENYEGRKVMVWADAEAFKTCWVNEDLDPHFMEDRPSPVARFEPTDRGWELAKVCALELDTDR